MKTFIALILLSFTLSASAICNREAQFLGTVKNLQVTYTAAGNIENHSFQVKLGYNGNYTFYPSILCAMWEDELETAIITRAGNPTVNEGSAISGVMVFDEITQAYRIE